MRRWTALLPLFLLLTLPLLGACGDDGEEAEQADEPTATTAARATDTPTPVAQQPLASPTAEGSPEGTSRSPGGTGLGPPQATAEPAGEPTATPTERPVTVVTTPRPIATRPPAVPTLEPAATEPQPEGTEAAEGPVLLLEETFDSDSGNFFTGTTDAGVSVTIADGAYTLVVPDGVWQVLTSGQPETLADGIIQANVAFQSSGGAVGVVGRFQQSEDGSSYSFVVCWMFVDGDAGCHAATEAEFTELARAGPGAAPVQELNTLVLALVGTGLYFEVNGVEVANLELPEAGAGSWGVYAESFEGAGESIASYDAIGVWEASE